MSIAAFAVAGATLGQSQGASSTAKTPTPRIVTALADPKPAPESR